MSKSGDRQFREANAVIERTVAAFMSAPDRTMVRWEDVTPQYILEKVLLRLCQELTRRIDEYHALEDATIKLSNDLADYRDSQWGARV